MKVLFVASEAHPLAKTGGLGDVAGSLPLALRAQGVDARLILPAYPSAKAGLLGLAEIARIGVHGSVGTTRILEGRLPDSDMPVYLVDAPHYFNRPGGPYSHPQGYDWPDNAQRFGLFARVAVEVAQDRIGQDWRADVVHANDWQTGLVPALLSLEASRPATVFTVHNLAYMGLFGWEAFQTLGLPDDFWSVDHLEFWATMSFLKGGLVYSDWLTTVSPTYAWEIRTPAFGYGLEGLLNHRADRLVGILNGVDYAVWDPAVDTLLPARYSADDLSGKAECKRALQRHFNLAENPDVPLLGSVGRMVEQKGGDLIAEVLPQLLHHDFQAVILGSGEPGLQDTLRQLAVQYPSRIAVQIGYDERLAHLIEAGSDMFLMPSRFEPCGLNQIYSLRYGTLPIVHRTGGLADTVVDASRARINDGTANGFQFSPATSTALHASIERALAMYAQPEVWRETLMRRAMSADFSWEHSAEQYIDLYRQALGNL
ncbi:MAG: glycogen synthase GlgA [Gammaproteobacteria bacterium]|nr:glycogen synthase GlgA [Gammaproteobacteria bacterium]MCP5136497.1 glycogen synthase GlgA [Gammaproteobacteria bacterium]